jgi:hypothetical protein
MREKLPKTGWQFVVACMSSGGYGTGMKRKRIPVFAGILKPL